MVQQALITPEWRCAKGIELRLSSRLFGRSTGQYASLNLGLHVDDVPETVQQNRARGRSRASGPTSVAGSGSWRPCGRGRGIDFFAQVIATPRRRCQFHSASGSRASHYGS